MFRPEVTPSNFDDVGNFHEKFGLDNVTHTDMGPREVPDDVTEFRTKFMLEELLEFIDAAGYQLGTVEGEEGFFLRRVDGAKPDPAKMFDALLDLVYVAMGTAHFFGFPWQMGWRLVQRANMSKVRANADGSNSLRGHALDVVKPPGWTAPNIERLLERFGWSLK